MGTKSRVGQYGTIPEDVYIRKIEHTDIYEDPEQIESYQRQLLKDRTPDPYFFESDAPRTNSESQSILNLRYGGARSLEDPYLPDGTFLDFDHFDKDPRSCMPGPDFRKLADQHKARGKFINFYPDADDSVPSDGINPLQMRENIIQSLPDLKNRLKIFSTSMDARSTKATPMKFTGYCKDAVAIDQQILDLNSAVCMNRQDATTKLSNATHVGWLTDIDTRFSVAKYGQVRPEKPISKDWNKTARQALPDQMLGVSHEGINLTRDVAMMMINHIARKDIMHKAGQNILFGLGSVAANRSRKFTADGIGHLITKSMPNAAHTEYEGLMASRPALVPRVDTAIMKKTVVNPQILDYINDATRARKGPNQLKKSDLRDAIHKTATEHGIYVQDAARSSGDLPSTLQNREAKETQGHIGSMQVKHYNGLMPPAGTGQQNAHFEAFKGQSKEQATLQQKNVFRAQTVDDYVGDAKDYKLEGLTKERRSGGLGTKFLRGSMVYEQGAAETLSDVETGHGRVAA